MNREELQTYLGTFGTLTFDEGGEWINLNVEPSDFHALMVRLRTNELILFDYLFCLTCIDWKTHLTMVYHCRVRVTVIILLSDPGLTERSRK